MARVGGASDQPGPPGEIPPAFMQVAAPGGFMVRPPGAGPPQLRPGMPPPGNIHTYYVGIMICPFTGPKMFCAVPKFLTQPKNLTAFSTSSKTFVPTQKPILLNANHLFVWHKMFVTATICK